MLTLIVLGICAAVSLTGAICQSLRDHVDVHSIQYPVPDKSFTNFVSASTNQRLTVQIAKGKKICESLIKKIDAFLPATLKSKIPELKDMIEALGEFEGYALEGANKAMMTSAYNANTGKYSMFNLVFTPIPNTELMTVNLYDLTANFKLPASFLISEVTQTNFWRTKTTQSLIEKPREITPEIIIDAVSMAIAPALKGYVDMPNEVRGLFVNKTRSESPGINNIPSSFK